MINIDNFALKKQCHLMISVIVITYNQEHTIARTLDSVLMQRCHQPLEIVIGEDCSTDGTRAVCEDYARRYPDVVRLMPAAPNKGVVDNYFDCLQACRGEFVADCAGDDYWIAPDKLEKECRIMEDNPDVTIVHTNWRNCNEATHTAADNRMVPFPSPMTDGRHMLEAIITQTDVPVIHLCTAMYRAATIKKCYAADVQLFRNRSYGCEDVQVAFMLALNGTVAYLPDVTLAYTIGKPSVSCQNDSGRQFDFVHGTASLSWTLASRYGIDSDRTRRFFALRVFELYMHAFRCCDNRLKAEASACMGEWRVRPDLRITAVRFVVSNALAWRITLQLRRVFVGAKHLLSRLRGR